MPLKMKKNNLTKQFYTLIKENQNDDLSNWTENFINSHNCYELREFLIKYREAVKSGKFKITPDEQADLDKAIDSQKCKDLAQIYNEGGLQCCYDEKTHEDKTAVFDTVNLCNKAKSSMVNEFEKKIKSDRQRVVEQMCWFNDNYIKDKTVTFCKSQTQQQTNQGTNTTTELGNNQSQPGTNTTTQGDNNQNKETENKSTTEEKPKPTPVQATKEVANTFDSKYPCLKDLPTKTSVDSEGYEYSYKVEKPTEDETVYYYLSGKCKIKNSDGSIVSKYFRCP